MLACEEDEATEEKKHEIKKTDQEAKQQQYMNANNKSKEHRKQTHLCMYMWRASPMLVWVPHDRAAYVEAERHDTDENLKIGTFQSPR